MRKEFHIFLTSVLFYTRINVSKWVNYKDEYAHQSSKYLPLIGWFVGASVAGSYLVLGEVLNDWSAVIISLLIGVLITGGFHEDGLADTCDGFGGGWKKEDILRIMKDSTIGTYGTIGLIFLFALKIVLMVEVYTKSKDVFQVFLLTISAHAISRWIAVTFLFTDNYVRLQSDSKSKSAVQRISVKALLISVFFGILPLFTYVYYTNQYWYLLMPLALYIFKMMLGKYFNTWIDGYTGDTLGATQQITEVLFFIGILIIWKFI